MDAGRTRQWQVTKGLCQALDLTLGHCGGPFNPRYEHIPGLYQGKIGVGGEHLTGGSIQQLKAVETQRELQDRLQYEGEIGLTRTTNAQREFPWWQGVELARQFNNDSQRPQGADIQFI